MYGADCGTPPAKISGMSDHNRRATDDPMAIEEADILLSESEIVDELDDIESFLNAAFTPRKFEQAHPTKAAMAIKYLACQLEREVRNCRITGFNLEWDGGRFINVSRSVRSTMDKSLIPTELTLKEVHKIT